MTNKNRMEFEGSELSFVLFGQSFGFYREVQLIEPMTNQEYRDLIDSNNYMDDLDEDDQFDRELDDIEEDDLIDMLGNSEHDNEFKIYYVYLDEFKADLERDLKWSKKYDPSFTYERVLSNLTQEYMNFGVSFLL